MSKKTKADVKATSEPTTNTGSTSSEAIQQEATPHDAPVTPQPTSEHHPWPYGSAKPAVKTFDEDPDGQVL